MNITLHLPQLIFIILTVIGLSVHLTKDGELKTGRYNFTSQLIAEIIIFAILIWGGFFG